MTQSIFGVRPASPTVVHVSCGSSGNCDSSDSCPKTQCTMICINSNLNCIIFISHISYHKSYDTNYHDGHIFQFNIIVVIKLGA